MRNSVSSLLVIFWLALWVIVRQCLAMDDEPCARLKPVSIIGSLQVFNPPDLLECLETTPFSPSIRDNVMGAVTAMYESLAIFQYNQFGDPSPALSQNVDVLREFQRINGTTYQSDYDFNKDLSDVMWSLNDEHHGWISCYDYHFPTQHTFPIVALMGDNKSSQPQIHLAPDLEIFIDGYGARATLESEGINVTRLRGARVLEIEGREVMDYLEETAAPAAGQYQDPNQRLNSLFAGLNSAPGGGLQRYIGAFVGTRSLSKATLSMKVEIGPGEVQDISVPYATGYSGEPFDFTSGDDLFERLCHVNTKAIVSNETSSAVQEQLDASDIRLPEMITDEWIDSIYASCPMSTHPTRFPFPSSTDPTMSSAYLGGRDIQFYILEHIDDCSEGKVGVIVIPTFAPTETTTGSPCSIRWILDAIDGVRNLTRLGVERVMIDTSNNTGGWVTLNQILQRLLTGGKHLGDNDFESVMVKSDLTEAMMAAYLDGPTSLESLVSPWKFRAPSSVADLPNSTNLFSPGATMHINGHTLQTSNHFRLSIDLVQQAEKLFNLSAKGPFKPENIVFTGNGLCSSACALFTNYMIEYFGTSAYISTVRPGRPIEFQASAGGRSKTSDDLYEELEALGLSDSGLVPRLAVNGTLGLAVRGAISPRLAPGKFLQYRSSPAERTYTQKKEQYLDPVKNWRHVASVKWGDGQMSKWGDVSDGRDRPHWSSWWGSWW